MISRSIDLKTPEGTCDAHVVYPKSGGPFPAVLLYMDAFGPRPYLKEMASQLASKGYYVLLPNLVYRMRKAPVTDIKFPMKEEDRPRAIEQIMPLVRGLTPEQSLADAGVFLGFLDQQNEVRPGPIGVTGYCMGGTLAIRLAAWHPDRIAAAASFHGGHLATEAEDSPHRMASKIRGELYIAHADKDQSAPPEQIERLSKALTEAGVRFEAEVYEGAIHGFTMRDLPPFNAEALERHWVKLSALLERTLKTS